MEFSELLYKRRSVRAFTDKELTRDEIDKLLMAATRAPNACNMQSWHFYAVTDKAVKAKFADFCAPWASTAPVIFVVCTDGDAITARFGERAKLFTYQDTALAAENMLLAAADMGYNGCFMGAFDADKCRRLLDIPEKMEIVALIPIGEAQTESPLRERKPMDAVATYVSEAPMLSDNATAKDDRYLLRDTQIKRARFENVNMTGVEFDNVKMAEGSFKSCNFTNVTLDGCTLDGMTIDGVDIAEAIEFYKKNKK